MLDNSWTQNYGEFGLILNTRNAQFNSSSEGKARLIFTLDPINLISDFNIKPITTTTTTTTTTVPVTTTVPETTTVSESSTVLICTTNVQETTSVLEITTIPKTTTVPDTASVSETTTIVVCKDNFIANKVHATGFT